MTNVHWFHTRKTRVSSKGNGFSTFWFGSFGEQFGFTAQAAVRLPAESVRTKGVSEKLENIIY